MTKFDKDFWTDLLLQQETAIGFSQGFKLLYCPWRTIDVGTVAFISLNPGRAPDDAELRIASDERGNSYEVERASTVSPITDQFLRLCTFIQVNPGHVLTGVAAPFRSGSWAQLSREQRNGSLELGRRFWGAALNQPRINKIIAVSNEASNLAVGVTRSRIIREIPSGWGNIKIRVFENLNGVRVVQLPHLSRFRLFGRSESESYLAEALT